MDAPHPPIHTRILNVYIEPLIEFSHIVTPDVDSLINCSLAAMSLKTAPTVGTVDRVYILWTGEGTRSLGLPEFSSWASGWSQPLNDLLGQTSAVMSPLSFVILVI